MRNFVFISPHFPDYFWNFVKALRDNGFNVLGVGDCPYESLSNELKEHLTDYYYCYDMENFDREVDAVRYFREKYGEIEYIESMNEYWLERDARLRELFHVPNGPRPEELIYWQKKSLMKEKYKLAGLKTAKYQIVGEKEELLNFIKKVGYPVFIKPNIGVGAEGDYKIKNEEDLDNFYNVKNPYVEYICEQFLAGNIISFDGIADANSDVVFAASNFFPPSIASIVQNKKDLFYYTLPNVPFKLLEIGKKTIKAFKVNNRYFHLEFFILTEDIVGFAKKGEIIPLETNMRPAGGYTPHMINFANSIDTFKIYADILAFGENRQLSIGGHFFCACASRRDGVNYAFSDYDIYDKYQPFLCLCGRYADVLSGAMGNRYFIAKFTSEEDMEAFKNFVELRNE